MIPKRILAALAVALPLAACDDPPIDLVSDEKVTEIGLQNWQQIKAEVPLSRNAALQERLARVSSRVLRSQGYDPADWEVVVFASDQVNAFALPGNKIGVFEGMFRVFANDDQLAAIVGHEVGHLQAEHGQERINAQVASEWGIGAIALILSLAEVENAEDIAALLGIGLQYGVVMPYNREQELEADRLGLISMAEAGYRPAEAVDFWRRMDKALQGRPPEFLATHPAPASRIRAIEEMLPEVRGQHR